jgi:hypothetical protein
MAACGMVAVAALIVAGRTRRAQLARISGRPRFILEHIFSQRRAAECVVLFFTHERHNDEVDILAMQGVRAICCTNLGASKFGRNLQPFLRPLAGGSSRDLVSRAWLLVSGQSWPKAKAEVERKAAKQSRPLALRRAQKVPLPKQRRLIQAQRQARRAAMAVAKSHSKPQAKRAVTRLSQKRTARRMR